MDCFLFVKTYFNFNDFVPSNWNDVRPVKDNILCLLWLLYFSRHVTGIRDGRDAGILAFATLVALTNVKARDLCVFSLL
jgi:hypothetical protein